MMFTLPGLRETKSGDLPYVCSNVLNRDCHRFDWLLMASSGYMSDRDVFKGTSMISEGVLVRDWTSSQAVTRQPALYVDFSAIEGMSSVYGRDVVSFDVRCVET